MENRRGFSLNHSYVQLAYACSVINVNNWRSLQVMLSHSENNA